MLKMNSSRNTSSNFLGSNNEMIWIRARKCDYTPQRLAEIKVSDSEANCGHKYYKCKFCNLSKRFGDKKLTRVCGEFNLH